jgi:hypothetical protein
MHERRIPEWLRHAPAPSVRGFAMLAGAEAMARGILISVFVRRSVLYSGRTPGRTITSHHPRADIGASAAKAHFVRKADLDGARSEGPLSAHLTRAVPAQHIWTYPRHPTF